MFGALLMWSMMGRCNYGFRAKPIPEEFHTAARDPGWLIVAHNDGFERAIEERILAPRYRLADRSDRAASLHHCYGAGERLAREVGHGGRGAGAVGAQG